MLTPDELVKGFYDPRLGMLKLGILLARKHPDKIDDFVQCRTLSELATVAEIPQCEGFVDTGIKLLNEWLEDKGLL